MTVAEVTKLRVQHAGGGGEVQGRQEPAGDLLALDGTKFEGIKPLLKGPTALAWAPDAVAVAKAAIDYAKANDKFVVLGGALGTQMLDAAGIKALSELPSLDLLRGKLVGLIAAPATRIAGVLQAPGAQLARVLAAHANKTDAPAEAEAA